MRGNQTLTSFKLPFVASIICVIGMLVGMRLQESLVHDQYLEEIVISPDRAIYEVSEHIQNKYYGDLETGDFTDAVINGMVDQLDPYSHYFEADRSKNYDRYVNGLFRGIGIEFVEYRDSIFVATVINASPADQAGIKTGDLLMSYDTINLTSPLVNLDSIKRVKEKAAGDKISLGVGRNYRNNAIEEQDVEIEVTDLKLPLIEDFVLTNSLSSSDNDSISYIKIKRFYKGVYRDFMEALEKHKRDYLLGKWLIIDLRDNPGGIVEETIKILDQLVREKNQLLLSTVSKVAITKEYMSSGRSFLNTERIVVLCNEQSASASEILAGVLQDYDQALLIGRQTFGKGLIQQNYDLANNASINLSIGEYVLPTGRKIHPSSHIDSTYESLLHKRPLYSERGVSPDLSEDACLSKKEKGYMFHLMVHFNLWSLEAYENYDIESLNQKLLAWGIKEDCHDDFHGFVKWTLAKTDTPYGETVGVLHTDPMIQKAFNILRSDDYNELLGVKN